MNDGIFEKYGEYIKALPEDLQEKIRACKNETEVRMLLSNAEGELPDEIAEAVSGGKDNEIKYKYSYPCWGRLTKDLPVDHDLYPWAREGRQVYIKKEGYSLVASEAPGLTAYVRYLDESCFEYVCEAN